MVSVSIAEAAERLAVSQDTVRRRLRSGKLSGERVARPQGFIWAVHLDSGPGTHPMDNGDAPTIDRRTGRRFWGRVGRRLPYFILGLSVATLARKMTRF